MSYDPNTYDADNMPEPTGPVEAMAERELSCKMEHVARDGLCGRKATHIWRTKTEDIPVCDICLLGPYICGGDLIPIPTPSNPQQT